MGYIKRMRDKGNFKRPSYWFSFLFLIVMVGGVGGFVLSFPVTWFLNANYSTTQVCTVESAKLHSSSSGSRGPTASRSIHVESPDCGFIVITDVKSPGGVNDAGLTRILQENEGKKFEFVIEAVQIFNGDTTGSTGVTSTTPVN